MQTRNRSRGGRVAGARVADGAVRCDRLRAGCHGDDGVGAGAAGTIFIGPDVPQAIRAARVTGQVKVVSRCKRNALVPRISCADRRNDVVIFPGVIYERVGSIANTVRACN